MIKPALIFATFLSLGPAAGAAAAPFSQKFANEQFAAADLKIDTSFSPKERIDLARGLAYIPHCLRQKLRGLRIRRSTGDFFGQRPEGSDHIKINPTYFSSGKSELPAHQRQSKQDGGLVHELFHVIGEWNNDHYYRSYLALDPEGECPVSDYGREQDTVQEDFAEAARLIYVPATRGDRRKYSCVDVKLKALRKIFDACK